MNILWLLALLIITLSMGVGQNFLSLSSVYEKLSGSANQEKAKQLERLGDALWYSGCGFCVTVVILTEMELWYFIVLLVAGFYYTPFFKDWMTGIYWRAVLRAIPSSLLLWFVYSNDLWYLGAGGVLIIFDLICISICKK